MSSYSNGGGNGVPYGSYGGASSYNSYGGGGGYATASAYGATSNNGMTTNDSSGLRRRTAASSSQGPKHAIPKAPSSGADAIKNLDILFPKVDTEFTVQSESGGLASLLAMVLIGILCIAEIVSWSYENAATKEHIRVNTDLGKRMRVNMNITFPGLACEDLHVDAMDVAGDSQLDIEETLVKRRLHGDGSVYSSEEIDVEMNQAKKLQEEKEKILKEKLAADYCGPCYGAHQEEGQCCQTCDEVIGAYKKKNWKTDLVVYTSEQCIREGRDKKEPKRMTRGQGCNLSGYMTVNRVAGNFHIAMGEGVERDGRHIHVFVPEDTPNFNASHIIHELTFGPTDDIPMKDVTKIVSAEHGTSGLFQYFIKVVPTTFKGKNVIPASVKRDGKEAHLPALFEEEEGDTDENVVETNRYFYTERFRPLMREYLQEEHMEEKDDDSKKEKAAVEAGHSQSDSHSHKDHHNVQNSVLPGIFFIYEIYPFSVEVTREGVPLTHLLIRLLATVGGVFTVVSWAESALSKGGNNNRRKSQMSLR